MASAYDQIYRPLESGDSRLVHLAPGKHNDPIICFLEPFFTQDPPPYVALSYVWGDPKITAPISVDGYTLQVTTNLEIALRHLRQHEESRTLWIDAIVINQSDMEERSQQVALMADIYRKAKSVTVWLGPEDAHSAWIFRLLRKPAWKTQDLLKIAWSARAALLDSGNKNKKERSLCGSRRLYQARTLFLPLAGRSLNDHLSNIVHVVAASHLVRKEWFSRRWCLQEFLLARSVTVHCGAESAIWIALKDMFQGGIRGVAYVRTAMSDEISNKLFAVALGLEEFKSFNGFRKLSELLYAFRMWLNGDPKDTIYGLLALADVRQPGFTVDYTRSNVDVFVDVIEYTLCYDYDLNLIGVPWAPNIAGLPSWIVSTDNDLGFRSYSGLYEPQLYSHLHETIDFLTSPWRINARIVRQGETSPSSPAAPGCTLSVDGLTLETYGITPKLFDNVPSDEVLSEAILERYPFNLSHFWLFTKDAQKRNEISRKPGDRTVVLFGCNHLLVLRPVEAHFILVESWLGHFWDFLSRNSDNERVEMFRKRVKFLLTALPTETFTIA